MPIIRSRLAATAFCTVRFSGSLALLLASAGCASRIETVIIDPKTLQVSGSGGVEGIVYYEPMRVKIRHEFTQLVDKDKKLLGNCLRVLQKEEIVTLPDYKNARAILHKPAIFAATEFGATLDNGMLVSVTSKSTPQAPPIFESIIGAKDVGIFGAPTGPAVTACNAGPAITSIERYDI